MWGLTDTSASTLVLPAGYSPLIVLLPMASLNPGKYQITMGYCTLDAFLYKAAKEDINGSTCLFLNIVPKCELHFIHYHLKHTFIQVSNWTLRFMRVDEQDKCFLLSVSTLLTVVLLTWHGTGLNSMSDHGFSYIYPTPLQGQQNIPVTKLGVLIAKVIIW